MNVKFNKIIGSALAFALVAAVGCSSDDSSSSASTAAAVNTAAVNTAQAASGATVRVSSMATPRGQHTATGTPGGVVVIGGEANGQATASIEVYDNGAWVQAGQLNEARQGHTATLLSNGKIMVAGGQADAAGNQVLSSIEIVDPVAKTSTPGPMMGTARSGHIAVPFRIQGKEYVLLAGGAGLQGSTAKAELYDVARNNVVPLSAQLTEDRVGASAIFLPSGQIMIQGGLKNFMPGSLQVNAAGAELFDPANRTFTKLSGMAIDRYGSALALSDSGKPVVFGGNSGVSVESSGELYDAASGAWSNAAALGEARENLTLSPLRDGRLLAVAGSDQGVSATVEAYSASANEVERLGSLIEARTQHTATLLPNGNVLVVGGYGSNGALASVEEYSSTAPPGTQPTQAPAPSAPVLNPTTPSTPVAPAPAPRILALYPTKGKPGDLITIAGQNFDKDKKKNQVMFEGGAMGNVLFDLSIKRLPLLGPVETLVVEVPQGAQTGNMVVITNGQASGSKNFTIDMQSGGTPSVLLTLPKRADAGDMITLFGRNFARPASDNIVRFSGEQAQIIGGITTQSVPFLGNLSAMLVRVPSNAVTGDLTVEAYGKVSSGRNFEVKGTQPATSTSTGSTGSTSGSTTSSGSTSSGSTSSGSTASGSGSAMVFYSEDFEGATLSVSQSGGLWEASRPQANVGPGMAASGNWAAGTAMSAGTYSPNASGYLITAEIDLTTAQSAKLRFNQFFDTDGTDGGRVIVSPDNGATWYLVRPTNGYLSAGVFNPGEGFAGFSGSWVQTECDLSAFAGDKITIAFEFAADGSDERSGWYLDDIVVEGN